MQLITHRDCIDTLRESILKVDSGRKIPCRTGNSNPRQYCAWLFSRSLLPTELSPAQEMVMRNVYILHRLLMRYDYSVSSPLDAFSEYCVACQKVESIPFDVCWMLFHNAASVTNKNYSVCAPSKWSYFLPIKIRFRGETSSFIHKEVPSSST